jgi:hypothetical protein
MKNTYPISELLDVESLRTLQSAANMLKPKSQNFFWVIDGVLASEREYHQWLENGGHAGSR